jgi:hypothetical protein
MMEIFFESSHLLACPSAQLQNVGRLKDGYNTAELRCLPGTVVCGVREEFLEQWVVQGEKEEKLEEDCFNETHEAEHLRTNSKMFKFDILSIASRLDGTYVAELPDVVSSPTVKAYANHSKPQVCASKVKKTSIGERDGYIGHATLTYPSGGILLVSTSHWIEISRIHADHDSTLYAIQMQFGIGYREMIEIDLAAADADSERDAIIQRAAQQLIQSSAPSSYSIGPRSNSARGRSAVL